MPDVLLCRDEGVGRVTSPHTVLALAAGIEHCSEHPLARAIVRHAEAQGVTPVEASDFRALTSVGASARMNGRTIYVGSPDRFHSRLGVALDCAGDDIDHLPGEGKTVVVVGDEKAPWGLIAIRDDIRPNARRAIEALHELGVEKAAISIVENPACGNPCRPTALPN